MNGERMRATATVLLTVFAFLLQHTANAQPFLSAYVPGNYLADNHHLVELSSDKPTDLTHFLLITRDYSTRFPEGTYVSPSEPLRVVKRRDGNEKNVLQLAANKDFLIRFRDRENEGNYAVLLDRDRKIVDAFYHSPIPSVPWLPVRDTLITIKKEYLDYYLPSESDKIWNYISLGDDPAVAFRRTGGAWRIVAVTAKGKPAAEYRNLNLRYNEGVVTVRWSTALESGLSDHIIERSTDQEHFTEVDRIPAAGNSDVIRNYSWADTKVEPDKTYYYKIRTGKSTLAEASSRMAEVKTVNGPEEFTMDVFFLPQSGTQEVNLRFFSRYAQKVKIKILDSAMREVAILFNDYVPVDSRNLLKIGEGLKEGDYYFVADTDSKRFWQKLRI